MCFVSGYFWPDSISDFAALFTEPALRRVVQQPIECFSFLFFSDFENFLQRFSKDRMFEEKYVKEKISNDDPCR